MILSSFILWNINLLVYSPLNYTLAIPCKRKKFYGEIRNRLTTGDILLFCGKTFGQSSLRALTQSYFDHSAMVVKTNDEIYLWESDIGQNYKSGTRLIPIKEKLDKYSGFGFFIYIPYCGTTIDKDILMASIVKNSNEKLHGKIGLIKYLISFSIFKPLIESDQFSILFKGKFCSELLFETLIDCHIVKKDCLASGKNPNDFLYINDYTWESPFGPSCLVYF